MNTYNHINDCVNALESCKTIDEVYDLLDTFPRWSGEWWVDIIPDGDGNPVCEVTNQYWDEQYEELCVNTYELEIKVEDEDL